MTTDQPAGTPGGYLAEVAQRLTPITTGPDPRWVEISREEYHAILNAAPLDGGETVVLGETEGNTHLLKVWSTPEGADDVLRHHCWLSEDGPGSDKPCLWERWEA